MSVSSPTNTLHVALKQGQLATFNSSLAEACVAFGIEVFAFNWSRDAAGIPNCYEGNRSLEQLMEKEEPDLPAVAWWIGAGQDANETKARAFSGPVVAGWRFMLAVRGKSSDGLCEMRWAVESALLAVLLRVSTGGRVSYVKDLAWTAPAEIQWADRDAVDVGWIQEVNFTASFKVNL